MHALRRISVAAAAVVSLLVPAAPAAAGIWSPIASGTPFDITAVADLPSGSIVYGTASGQVLKDGTSRSANPGASIISLAFSPNGIRGLATATNGRLLRTSDGGDTWSVVSLANTSRAQTTPCLSAPSGASTPTGNLTGAAWSSDTTAYVTATDLGVVLKTTDGGVSWTDVGRQADGHCRVDPNGDLLTDVATVPGSDVAWFVDDAFGATFLTADGLASDATRRSESAVSCFNHLPRLALDADSPDRAFMVDRCDGALQLGTTTDGGTSWELSHRYFAGDPNALRGLNDVAVAGGVALAAGNGGAILIAPNASDVYFQRADGALGTTDWLSVAKRSATHAVVGGRGGALIQTNAATTIPDVVPPAGTVSGPATAVAGVPVTYTANVADDAGGSGIDPAGFAWSAPGLPAAAGNPATITFPSPGFYAITVAFRDLAGNPATSGISVRVDAPIKGPAPAPTPAPAPAPTKAVKTTTATVPGATIRLGTPSTCVAPGRTFRVTLTWKKQKRKGNRFVKVRRADFSVGAARVKIDRKAPFTQTLTIKAGTRPGSKVTVRARAYIKVSKGKSPTKSIATTIKVC